MGDESTVDELVDARKHGVEAPRVGRARGRIAEPGFEGACELRSCGKSLALGVGAREPVSPPMLPL